MPETTHYKVTNLIKSLGKTPDEIAESLIKDNITGTPLSFWFCPIARFLRKKSVYGVSADGMAVQWRRTKKRKPIKWPIEDIHDDNGTRYSQAVLERHQRKFCSDFDKLRYPELITPGWKPVKTADKTDENDW